MPERAFSTARCEPICSKAWVLLLGTMLSACGPGSASAPAGPGDTAFDLAPGSEHRTLLLIGQDSDTIAGYVAAMPELEPLGVTLYTSLRAADPDQTLPGVLRPVDLGAGVTDFERTLAELPEASLAVGLSLTDLPACAGTHTGAIAAGEYDQALARLLTSLGDLSPRPVLLRIGYEFDGPWNCYEPRQLRAAFRHVHEQILALGASNVLTVWQSAAWPDPGLAGARVADYDHRREDHLERWYPGDDVVDWIGMSVFYRGLDQWSYEPPYSPVMAQERILAFARSRDKPVLVAEAAPQGFSNGSLTARPIQGGAESQVTAQEIWDRWYRPFFDFIRESRDVVRAVAYINTEWQAQPMWYCPPGAVAGTPSCPNGYWGDSRVQANPLIRELWLREISDASQWLQPGHLDPAVRRPAGRREAR